MLLQKLKSNNQINCPAWVPDNTQWLVQMGSVAYGVSTDSSDIDVYGFCIPPKEHVFPHLAGHVQGFATPPELFSNWQQHHVQEGDQQYDFMIYGIVNYFHLLLTSSPNVIDSIFVPRRCVLHSTMIGELVRENRKLFLSRKAWPKFKGYAYGQLHKAKGKSIGDSKGRRADSIREHGFDIKAVYNVVRLLGEIEQILVEGDLDLERNREQLKSIRRGEWTLERIEAYFAQKESGLEDAYLRSTLPAVPDEDKIKALLLQCLEHHYGDLSRVVRTETTVTQLVGEMQKLLNKYQD